MAKIREGGLAPNAPRAFKGRAIIRRTQSGSVLAKWPNKRGKGTSGYEYYRQQEFARAAAWASNPEPHAAAAAIELAKGSDQVPRDLIMMATYGTLHEIWVDGIGWMEHYRVVAPNAQLVLDQVTDTPGAMLWRAPFGWIEIPPGGAGYFLRYGTNIPEWVPVVPPEGATPLPGGSGLLRLDAGTNTANNVCAGSVVFIPAGTVISKLSTYATAAAATSVLAPVIYKRTGNTTASLVAYGAQVTGVINGINSRSFSPEVVIDTDEFYFVGFHISAAVYSQANSNSVVASWSTPTSYPPPSTLTGLTQAFLNSSPHPWIN